MLEQIKEIIRSAKEKHLRKFKLQCDLWLRGQTLMGIQAQEVEHMRIQESACDGGKLFMFSRTPISAQLMHLSCNMSSHRLTLRKLHQTTCY